MSVMRSVLSCFIAFVFNIFVTCELMCIVVIEKNITHIQSKVFEKSIKKVRQPPPLSSTFFLFSNIASNECWELMLF